MGGLYSRLKTWLTLEDVTAANLNAEFDNVLTNFVPLMIDDYSTNVTQMQVKTDPGEVGSESLATTLAGELARLRFMISEITGQTQWYTSPGSSLLSLANALGSTSLNNRLVSGRVLTTSSQPAFLVPHGSAKTITLKGATTNFLYYVNGTQYTISTDVTITSLTAAPSSNNTALVNDATFTSQDFTKYLGENGSEIPIDTIGSEISALTGKFAAFKVVQGGNTEYFIGYVNAASISKCRRSNFFDTSDNPLTRIAFSDNAVITLMKLSWIFAKTDGTITVTYTNPVWDKTEPTSPSNGDYWFDIANQTWKFYNVSAFETANATLVGYCFQNTTACIGARSFEFFLDYDNFSNVEVIFNTNAQVISRHPGSSASIWGNKVINERNLFTWDMTVHLDSGVTEGSSTYYYFYITQSGQRVISDVRPQLREEIKGYYHPHQSWRCFGSAFNNASSNLIDVNSYFTRNNAVKVAEPQTAASIVEVVDVWIPLNGTGGAFTKYLPPAASCRGQILNFIRTDNTAYTATTLDAFGSETIRGALTYALYTQYETVSLLSTGVEWLVVNNKTDTPLSATVATTITGSTTNPTKGSITKDSIMWYRRGKWANFEIKYHQTSGGADGSGAYLILLPSSLVADVTEATGVLVNAAVTQPLAISLGNLPGHIQANNNSTWAGYEAILHSSTQVHLAGYGSAGGIQVWGSAATGFALATNPVILGGWFSVPIAGWEY